MSRDGLDVLELGTAPGPLLEAPAWHSWVGVLGYTPACMVAGPTRRPGRDLVLERVRSDEGVQLADGVLRYVRSWPREPDDDERAEVFDRFLLELERARAELGESVDLDAE